MRGREDRIGFTLRHVIISKTSRYSSAVATLSSLTMIQQRLFWFFGKFSKVGALRSRKNVDGVGKKPCDFERTKFISFMRPLCRFRSLLVLILY